MKESGILSPQPQPATSKANEYLYDMSPSNEHFHALLRKDESQFMAALFKEFFPLACKTIYRFVQDMPMAEDLAQDVFIKIWNRRHSLGDVFFKAYVQKAAINMALDHIDKKKRQGAHTELSPLEEQLPAAPISGNLRETSAQIEAAIGQLPEKCREIFILSRYEELSYKEIASTLNISVKTVENQMITALKKLRVSLKDYLTS
ncbi:RNA polymerase sigma-70 factor (ECF subfamily) [Chitinophaga skermanii]|uniref:RNA polymerase sigma-70 factor (ECF subfamily) n=1 Tax=Chitinophaga skermanii TaxID=331697 RepID=A0A327R3Q5_9BACT|nr:RNA polymerase sigma-70 factor [Chitinophaga skermanii]RAJ10592.1 RNA polymerase sigma-70 factor (ECF subfamily) [Chitinophaga skermanii]